MKADSGCSDRHADIRRDMLRDHKKKDDKVFAFFREVMEDIGTAFQISPETKKDMISPRVQLISIFTFIDVAANYWFEYLNRMQENSGQKSRFLSWCNQYCFTKSNDQFIGDISQISGEELYEFRCSMVHFAGMPKTDDARIVIAPNFVADEEILDLKGKFKQRGWSTLFVKSKSLHNLILEGAVLMLGDWKQNIDDSGFDEAKKWAHIEGIDRIYQRIMEEGALTVALSEKK